MNADAEPDRQTDRRPDDGTTTERPIQQQERRGRRGNNNNFNNNGGADEDADADAATAASASTATSASAASSTAPSSTSTSSSTRRGRRATATATAAATANAGPGGAGRGQQGAYYWCFTWNNPPTDYEEIIQKLYDDEANDIEYIVYGRETGESGTFHLQGFVHFGGPILNSELATNGPAQRLFQAHWTKARRVRKARDYCLKDGNYTEHGSFCMRQGRRTDLDEFKAAAEAGTIVTAREARKQFSEVAARYPRFVESYINDHRQEPQLAEHEMYPWQRALHDLLTNKPPDPRQVIFVVDITGNTGKSWFAKKVAVTEGVRAQYMTPGKVPDMSYALQEDTNVLLMDCPRSRVELFQYDFIEYVKNGLVFSTKYESRMKHLKPCHVVVFMNEHPDMAKLSADRYRIVEIGAAIAAHGNPETEHIRTWEDLEAYAAEQEAARPRYRGATTAPGFFFGRGQGPPPT